MKLVLVGRVAPVIPGIGVDLLAATSTIGDDVIRADITEAEAVVAARGFDVDPFLALESSGGWIAGLAGNNMLMVAASGTAVKLA